ncbi:putative glycosyltransferase EpsJ [Methanobrevibacter cuticularis]|uniref:Putative glycosyltransferase EpsJ n=1 Tax=Methanobrevibacter cuticularis TaxID=47311 RepID=A0A166DX16_9EURY|nr:glycosyltransferase [Methanobrevibacter cuticularis]KZX16042.1 putative glycosyltransferase EpsJ [Methanobrevibacter cuticularis]
MSFKISIIIPIHNVEDYIEKAFSSVKSQTLGFKNLEVIMVDDASTDKSGKIIDEYANKYSNCFAFHLEDNTGSAGIPRNVAMAHASSPYIMFLDPDDYYEDNACELLYDEITKEDIDIVFGNRIENKGNILKIRNNDWFSGKTFVENIDENMKLLSLSPALSGKIIRKDFLEKNKIEFVPNIPGQDTIFVYEVFFNAKGIKYLPNECIYIYVFRESSITNNITLKYINGTMKGSKIKHDLFLKYGKEFYIKNIFRGFLNYLLPKILFSNFSTKEEFEKVLIEMDWFIKKNVKYANNPKNDELKLFFSLMVTKDIENILRYKRIMNANKHKIHSISMEKNKLKNKLKIYENHKIIKYLDKMIKIFK